MRKYMDIVSGSFFLLLAIGLYIATYGVRTFSDTNFGVTFLPRVAAVLMGCVSLVVIHGGVVKLRTASGPAALPEVRGFFMTGTLIFLYIILLPGLGFILDTFAYITLQVGILSGFDRRKMLLGAAIGAVFSVGVYLVFSRLVYIMLPEGILG